ncbi:TPA: hypothetical protein U1W00_000030 [Streptococcus suis]|nr:hypothetical protein [Streptococcus suis]NQM39803.1 hypothetical protein [Streptococcus suis]HEM4052124.1 hypothetical protein [Streptococcus suis]HEM4054477.1 hypothetical protein [Streptococcus suis]
MQFKSAKKYLGLLGLATLLTSSIVYADTSRVSGTLNRSGSLVQYDYTRTHTFDGPISLDIDDLPAGHLRLGLRNMNAAGGPQFTNTLQWNVRGLKEWPNILRGTRFAFQGRMKASGWGADNSWGGELTY